MVQTRKYKIALRRSTSSLLLLSALGVVPAASAQTLVQLFEAARATDATYQGARAQYDANLAKADQSRALILPSANLTAGASRNTYDSTTPPVDGTYTSLTASIGATQPLYRPGNWAGYEQGLKLADIAGAQLLVAEQELVIRVAQAYFDVLAAQDTLAFVQAQKTAVAEQLASARRNFEVGTATITDTREAQARHDLVMAQEIAAANDLRVKKLALDTVVSRTDARPTPLAQPVPLPALAGDVEGWVQQAEGHPVVLQARIGVDVARLETEKARAGHKPTVDLQASYGVNRYPQGYPSNSLAFGTRQNQAVLGVQMTVPLFAGFSVQNRVRETLSLEEKAAADLEAARRTVVQNTRTAYFGVMSGKGQVEALQAAEASSQSALDANKLGYQVGVRINIDVLNAQSQLYQTKRDLAQARYNVLLGDLRLRQASGSLRAEDLLAIEALLVR
ncbi:TolC family outer membrane protein [Pseudorhodoferax sp. Leaf274]|uniref:TolC family outer membrane protein n=1 Tax=Pseudorhodoferax sp. Leaf274 TaxID=1736318 RepID=UPI000702E9CB|nr:TolC family outer membrane protein [Pseudorhodoferax sp. Leaf274]KQP37209.1 channel protein TolC [Pseudorhodoferax sp. Leaf274]